MDLKKTWMGEHGNSSSIKYGEFVTSCGTVGF
jgi:hypothetical protein